MTLLIDIGNTALKWALAERHAGSAPMAMQSVHTRSHRDDDAWVEALAGDWSTLPRGTRAIGCTVAGAELRGRVDAIAARSGLQVQWLAAAARYAGDFVLHNGYRAPAQLGTDRWHGMLGACERRPRASFVLVAAGTATTADCVVYDAAARTARFVGGCIAPGARMMLDALAQRTAGLPLARGRAVDFPDHTDDAIATGVLAAQVGAARRMVDALAQRLGAMPAVMVSGGDAERVAAGLGAAGIDAAIEHNLVLAGLALRTDER